LARERRADFSSSGTGYVNRPGTLAAGARALAVRKLRVAVSTIVAARLRVTSKVTGAIANPVAETTGRTLAAKFADRVWTAVATIVAAFVVITFFIADAVTSPIFSDSKPVGTYQAPLSAL
jgi:hypothetical protein